MTKRQNIEHNENKKVYKTHHHALRECEAEEEIEEEQVEDDKVSTENSQPLIKRCICVWLVYQERSLYS